VKILNLEIKNIRGIKYIKIEPKGENVVIFGPNGTGKSAIVDAIDFLLTGGISRLSGEGTKGFSIKEHGCHIDSRDDLKNTNVVATVDVNGKEVILERSIKRPSFLKIEPKEDENLVKPYLDSATLGLHILSRREILKYVTSEAGKRAKEVMSLLNLSEIENYRSTLVTVRNEAKVYSKQADSGLEREKDEINKLLSLVSFSEEATLVKINELRETLGGDKVTELLPEKMKENLKAYPYEIMGEALTGQQIENTIKTIRSLVHTEDDFVNNVSKLRTLIEEVIKDTKFEQHILYEKLFEIGINLINVTNSCPLCGREWESGDLKSYLEEKNKETKISKENQLKIDETSSFLKIEFDVLKNNVSNCVKAHKQFSLKIINKNELEDYFDILDRWSEAMTTPLESFKMDKWPTTKLHYIFDAAFIENKVLIPLENALEQFGEEISLQQNAWDTLTKMEEQWKRYQQALNEKETCDILKNRSEAVLTHFEKARDSILENIYDAVKKNFEEYYKIIHSDDESEFTSKISQTGAELNLEVNFYQRGMFPPNALHSEGHQDSMGLCLFFALNNYLIEDAIKLIVLDDVIMSIDRTHRRYICQLLKKSFPDKQYIITTHDGAWARQLRTEGIVNQRNMIHFTNWNIDTGPIFELEKDVWDKIEEDLRKNEIPAAAHRLRRNAEYFFENICDFLMADIPYKGHHQWELGDFAAAAISTYKHYLRKAMLNSQKIDQLKYEELKELEKVSTNIITRSQIEQWAININVHYNKWDEFTANDIRPVVDAFKELFGLFTCKTCGTIISRTQSKGTTPKDIVSCGCGKIFWNIQ